MELKATVVYFNIKPATVNVSKNVKLGDKMGPYINQIWPIFVRIFLSKCGRHKKLILRDETISNSGLI